MTITEYQPAPIGSRESGADACARAIREAILAGELAPGQRLPPERVLAQSFQTSRLTLRAGLSQLAAAGLLTVRQGSGYVVQDFQRQGGPDLLGGLVELAGQRGNLHAVVADLLDVRRHLARAALERLATRWNAAAERRVARRLDAFARAVATGDLEAVAAADLEMTAALVAETHSPVLRVCLNPVVAVVARLPELRAAMYANPADNLAGYRLVLGWLDARRPDLIELVLRELGRRDDETLRRLASARRKPDTMTASPRRRRTP